MSHDVVRRSRLVTQANRVKQNCEFPFAAMGLFNGLSFASFVQFASFVIQDPKDRPSLALLPRHPTDGGRPCIRGPIWHQNGRSLVVKPPLIGLIYPQSNFSTKGFPFTAYRTKYCSGAPFYGQMAQATACLDARRMLYLVD